MPADSTTDHYSIAFSIGALSLSDFRWLGKYVVMEAD
jgi:hypothetical protein